MSTGHGKSGVKSISSGKSDRMEHGTPGALPERWEAGAQEQGGNDTQQVRGRAGGGGRGHTMRDCEPDPERLGRDPGFS